MTSTPRPGRPDAGAPVEWARRMAAMAQTGLDFATDRHDVVRWTELRGLAAEVLAWAADADPRDVEAAFTADEGYATPKVDVRGVAFDEAGRVLLVRERRDGLWTLPGGWADTGDTPSQAVAREFAEEAGMVVDVTRLLACWDRVRQVDAAPLVHRVYKLFFAVVPTGEAHPRDDETDGLDWFALDALPGMSRGRTTAEQLHALAALHADPAAPAAFH